MWRRLFAILSTLSLLMWTAALAWWVRSAFWHESRGFPSGNTCRYLMSEQGQVALITFRIDEGQGAFERIRDRGPVEEAYAPEGPVQLKFNSTWLTGRAGLHARYTFIPPMIRTPAKAKTEVLVSRAGFGWARIDNTWFTGIRGWGWKWTPGTSGLSARRSVSVVAVPYWFLVACFGVLPVAALVRRVRKRRVAAAGVCPACGYDLRATPERCPECGQVPERAVKRGGA